ncbi:MAG: glycosyltransferase family 4 protein [Ginsengibacter sp.]
MKIAFVSLMGGLPWGGSEALWHAIAEHALEQGDKVFVSMYEWEVVHEKIKQLREKGALIHFRKKFNSNAGKAEKIKRFIKNRNPSLNKDYQSIVDFRPDAVFISQGESFDLAIHHKALYRLLRQHNISYSFICHSHIQYGFISPAEIYPAALEIFKNARNVFFISQRQWHLTERRLATKIDNAIITWNPLNIKIPLAPLTWPADDVVQMAIVANISGSKGHDTAFEVMASPVWKNRKWILNIYGDGEGRKYLEDLAIFFGISGNIKFHGHVNDIINVWKENHVLLIPSAGEGLPISLVEAMACGRMAVVTDVGGNTELITENETGFIAGAPSVASFDIALENAWRHRDKWRQLGINAFNKINAVLEKEPQEKIYELLKTAP